MSQLHAAVVHRKWQERQKRQDMEKSCSMTTDPIFVRIDCY
jgi:hypothetical protein